MTTEPLLTGKISSMSAPVEFIPGDAETLQPEETGVALCLSGGGYRAMLFHAGALIRLNELKLLPRIDRCSSVSGGSIIAGKLALGWARLDFDPTGYARRLREEVIDPIRALAGRTVDTVSILGGILTSGTIADKVTEAYRKYLFGHATLQDLPERPRFVFNATNVQSKSLWRFSKPYMRDWRVGEVPNPRVELAIAVTASSAFPPVLSPLEMKLDPSSFTPNSGAELQYEPYTSEVVLTDGGVYDNLGLETAWKRYSTIWASDAGGMYSAEEDPKRDWLSHTKRVMDLIDNQVRSLRKRQLIGSFHAGLRQGAYWGIWTDIADFELADALPCPREKTQAIAETPTRLKKLDGNTQERIINWGYAVCDAALRSYGKVVAGPPLQFPYEIGIG
jgi:NTE family protein